MRKTKDSVRRLMDVYHKAAGVGLFYFDSHLNMATSYPQALAANRVTHLLMDRLLCCLEAAFSRAPSHENRYFTYFFHSKLCCNIIFLTDGGGYLGAFVTEPLLIQQMRREEALSLLAQEGFASGEDCEALRILTKGPVVPYERVMPLGNVLAALAQTLCRETTPMQVFRGPEKVPAAPIKQAAALEWQTDAPERHLSFSTYLLIKQAIQQGDVEALAKLIGEFSAADAPMHQLHSSDCIRAVKNSFVKACTMACYAAVDANAPYTKMLDDADEMIRKMETMDSITQIYNLLHSVFLAFTHSVADAGAKSYTKPVRQAVDYLQAHYNEKITLEHLAQHTGISTFYLSSMIKAQTGLSLADNIHKIRVEKSKKLLLSDASILDIAQCVGFRYQNHFATIFKKVTGLAPTEYRKTMGNVQPPAAADCEGVAAGGAASLSLRQL